MNPTSIAQSNKKFRVVSLFSGAGGFDWGFEQTGKFTTWLACEKEASPASTLAHNLDMDLYPVEGLSNIILKERPIVVHGDVKHIDFTNLGMKPDVLIGGPPCQDFSITIANPENERPGLNGGRGMLYIEFVKALMHLQPKFFVFENVEGLLSANGGNAITTIIDDLSNLEQKRTEAHVKLGSSVPIKPIQDYEIIFDEIVDTTKIGVPQTRKRLIVVGIRKDLCANDSFAPNILRNCFSQSLFRNSDIFSSFPLTTIEIFEGKPLDQLQSKYHDVMKLYKSLADKPFAADWRASVWSKLNYNDIVRDYYRVNSLDYSKYSKTEFSEAMYYHRQLLAELGWLNKPLVSSNKFPDLSNAIPKNSESVTDRMNMIPPDENYSFVDNTKWQVQGKGISFIYRRSHPLKPAWTVMAYGGGGTYGYHYQRNRSQLTLREKARIQTFSDDFEFQGAGVRAQIGEAVPPLLGKRIGDAIAQILERL